MHQHRTLLLTISTLTLLWTTCSTDSGQPFTIESDQVREGEYLARAISTTALESNYPVKDHALQQPILYKLSVNGHDNEAGFGQNHYLNIPPGIRQFYASTVVFGHPDAEPTHPQSPLTQSVTVHFRVDFRSVLNAWQQSGIYISPTSDSIARNDFRGLYLAGGTAPLEWLWDSGSTPDEMKFHDEDGDSIYTLSVTFPAGQPQTAEIRAWQLNKDLTGLPRFHSPTAPLLEAVYNLALEEALLNIRADSTFMAGKEWTGVWTRDISYAIDLGLAFPFPEISRRTLLAKVDGDGRIIQDTGTGGSWPVSTDRISWAIGAWRTFLATGDSSWLETMRTPILDALERDFNWNRTSKTMLFKGETSFKDWRAQTYPFWMLPADIGASQALSTNFLFLQAMKLSAFMAPVRSPETHIWSQRAGIYNNLLWSSFTNQRTGVLTDYFLSYPSLLPAPTRDALGEALAILFTPDTTAFMQNLIATYPRTDFGTPIIAPQLPDRQPYHNKAIWPFVETYQLLAAKKTGNQRAYTHSFQALTRAAALFLTHKENMVYDTGSPVSTAVNSDRQLWSVAGYLGAIYQGLFGINVVYLDERAGFGLELKPNNPWKWSSFRLTDFVVQGSRFDIHLKGTGDAIQEMRVNDQIWDPANPIPLKMPKKYRVVITLSRSPHDSDVINLQGSELMLPPAPVCDLTEDTLHWESNTDRIVATLNSMVLDTISASPWIVPDSLGGYLAFMALDSVGQLSLPTAAYLRGPSIYVKLIDKNLGYVDLGNKREAYTVEFTMRNSGQFAVRFLYANGEGPIETDNRCGVALMSVNSPEPQLMWSFPQLGDWETWSFTEWQPVKLQRGANQLTFDLEKWPLQNMNGKVNHFRIAGMELMPDPYPDY
ncbi:MAG: hypothetical protein K9N34_10275 [Candidatus Marinimicrobia bacterium]|nr:hypothetical protein [Candidatus Neomarinimicrobiota bacterium]MCF7840981.1 hypothetical protein [Candidatus Neomarinimicrobiota bacterium]MCF7902477.1 hypothetical protein [Candidatus Neomarinimicrobiota bacterium]